LSTSIVPPAQRDSPNRVIVFVIAAVPIGLACSRLELAGPL
jgi:hypothetical protein